MKLNISLGRIEDAMPELPISVGHVDSIDFLDIDTGGATIVVAHCLRDDIEVHVVLVGQAGPCMARGLG